MPTNLIRGRVVGGNVTRGLSALPTFDESKKVRSQHQRTGGPQSLANL